MEEKLMPLIKHRSEPININISKKLLRLSMPNNPHSINEVLRSPVEITYTNENIFSLK